MEIKIEPIDETDIDESSPPNGLEDIEISNGVNVKIEIEDYLRAISDQIEIEYEDPNYLSNWDSCNVNILPAKDIKIEPSDIIQKLRYCQDCKVTITRLPDTQERDLKIISIRSKAKTLTKSSTTHIKCPICQKWYLKANLEIHNRIHTGEKPYKCSICPKSFSQISSHKHHMGMHENYRPFPCTFCSRTFREKIKLASHIRTHTGEKPYKCTHCTKAFSDQSACKRHIRIHTGEKPHKCLICPKKFSDSAALWRHKKMHTGERNIICKTCGKGFSVLHNLKLHAESHTDIKYICKICKEYFGTQASLKRHEKKRHHNQNSKLPQNFDCKICNVPFANRFGLSVHNLTFHQIKEKLFNCDKCKEKFTERSQLTSHIKNKHSDSGGKVQQKKNLKKISKKM